MCNKIYKNQIKSAAPHISQNTHSTKCRVIKKRNAKKKEPIIIHSMHIYLALGATKVILLLGDVDFFLRHNIHLQSSARKGNLW